MKTDSYPIYIATSPKCLKFVDRLKVVEPALIVKKLPRTEVNERDYATVLFDELFGRTGVYFL